MSEDGCTIISISSEDDFKMFATNIQNGIYDALFKQEVQDIPKKDLNTTLESLLIFLNKQNAGLSMLFRPMNDWETENHQEDWIPKEIDNNNQITDVNCN